jgi:microcystin degradation protein MlrC
VDAVLLQLHGGSVAEGYDDPEGDLITRVREVVGPEVPIGVLLDPHTNLGEGMLNATALVFFKEYPHTDVPERAIDLFHLIADAAEGRTRPALGVFDCRMVGIFQTPRQPLRGFIDHYSELEGRDGVLSITVCQGFPYSDVPIGGTKMVVITDGDQQQADRLAEELGRELFGLREAMLPEYINIQEGLDRALAAPPGTVVIADYADNAGGGAPSDSTFVLRAMLERGIRNAAIGMFWDPIALSVALEAGEGARLPLRVGGKMGPTSGDPLDLGVTVTKITMDAKGKVMGGERIGEFGDLVALHTNGIDIVLTNRRTQPTSLDCFRQVGIEPTERSIVVVKSSQHFYAAFAPIACEILYVYSPGTLSPLMREIPYQRLPTKRLWPWNPNPFEE